MKKTILAAVLGSSMALSACTSETREPPTKHEIAAAMREFTGGQRVDMVSQLSCVDYGKHRYLCEFAISYIGRASEKAEKCFFGAGEKWLVTDSRHCE